MFDEGQQLSLIDLINKKQLLLKNIKEEKWKDLSEITISNSEFYIMSKVYNNKPFISHVAKQVHFSRQATHKFIRQLEEKGLAETKQANLRDKYIELTELGEKCYEKQEALKMEIEKMIAKQIGKDNVNKLKEILTMDWGL
ncbi:MAG: MarR family transcriptional regulator [Lysinibacillus sp.]|nr:MarR family transcriptional regulator [Lysinibacillus sp.]